MTPNQADGDGTAATHPPLGESLTAAVIINPVAGSARTRITPDEVKQLLGRHFFRVEVLVTTQTGEAERLARQAAHYHPVVVAVGGDGTVHEVARGLLDTAAALAILPAGSGNDFAFGLGIHSVAAGAAAAGRGGTRAVDVAYLDDRPFFNSTGLFLSGLVSHRASRLWRQAGQLRYVAAAASAIFRYQPKAASWRLESEPEARTGRWILAEISNGPRAGGGFMLSPAADPGDGLLDFCLAGPLGLFTLLRLFPAAASGKRFEHPQVYRLRAEAALLQLAQRIPIHMDGELRFLDAGDHFIRLEAGQLTVLAPASDEIQTTGEGETAT
ncbi:MAG: diacylglycerol kinase family protein [bacterium]